MQLTSLQIKGFKSFGDKISINFNEGVTAIVGPNGCGKSNVVDAIRWVLGEQSTRMLRSEKMDNIIFNGSKSRKPANLAEVSLTFDNTKNILPIEFSQVTLTRKLYRSGESEYRLNDVQCRLKDITDLFLDTGVGSDSYAIIELRMVEEIISNKEGSRRNLFEEASGISKYKLRKKQTFSKLKDTEVDLQRVDDLLFEIDKNLRSLENQAKKAERYYRIRDQYKLLSIQLVSFRIAFFGKSLAGIEQRELAQSTAKAALSSQIDTLEAALQHHRLQSVHKEKNLSVQQNATNDHIARIRAYESEKKLKNEQLKFQQDKETRLSAELERDQSQLNHVLYNIKRLLAEKTREEEELQNITVKLSGLKLTVDDLKVHQGAGRGELNELSSANNALQNQVYKTEKDLEILQIQEHALEQESQRSMEDATSKEAELAHFTRAIAVLQERMESLDKEERALAAFEVELQEQQITVDERLGVLKEIITDDRRKLDALQNEYNLTKSLVDNLEGFPESIRFLKKTADWASNAPLFSDILFCREEYRIAVENYLEPLMNHYVVNNYNEAISAIKLLSGSAKGRAQFLILNTYQTSDIAAGEISLPQVLENKWIPALQVIEVDSKYRALCKNLLKNVYLVDDANEQGLDNTILPDGVVLIGKSGRFSKSKYTMAGGSVGLFDGKRLGRAKNLDNLASNIKQLEIKVDSTKDELLELQSKSAALKANGKATELKQKQQEISRLQTEFITIKTRQEQYQAFINNSLNRKNDIAIKISGIKEEVQNILPLLSELKTQKQIQQDLLTSKQAVFNELNEHVAAQSNLYNQENIGFHQQQNKVSGLVKDLGYRSSQRENLETMIERNTAELEKVKAAIRDNLEQAGDTEDDLLQLYAQKEEMEKATQLAEREYYDERGKATEAESEISNLRHKKENAVFIENQLRDERTELKMELNALKERLSVEFNVDIRELPDNGDEPGGSEEELREITLKLKKQMDDMGAINPMAVEAYNEMHERSLFIQAQKRDLAEAKASLLTTIEEIDNTAREKFMSAFTRIRENFIRVFRSLFNEGDSCDLVLTDPEHPLESDIDIIARPKGKRPLSINQLSGGEKTLTATAILFSLYLLKPAPFCIFDEVDAPLDDTNIDKFNTIIREFSKDSQFIIVSHNKRTIASTDVIYGVTMVEQGISRVVPVDMRQLAD